jgi:hypothetical protein
MGNYQAPTFHRTYSETYSPNLNGVHNDGSLPTDPLVQLRVDRQYSV